MRTEQAKFTVGQLVRHKIYYYRGVVIDVDPCFRNSEAWYLLMTQKKPEKSQPWYHVLVDNTDYISYIAEQNMILDNTNEPIHHPDLAKYLGELEGDHYSNKRLNN